MEREKEGKMYHQESEERGVPLPESQAVEACRAIKLHSYLYVSWVQI